MTEGETDIGNQSLGLCQVVKIVFIVYGMKGNDAFLCNKSLKNSYSFQYLDLSSLHCTLLN